MGTAEAVGVKSLLKLRIKGKAYEILPVSSIYYLISLVLIIVFSAIILDRLLLPSVEEKRMVECSDAWKKENDLINENNRGKLGKGLVWHSAGFGVSIDKKVDKRILVMGDSYVWGDGYANMNDLWWRQLELELHKRGYTDLEVIAAGRSGWNTRWQFKLARKIVPILNQDIVIWGYVTNDPDEGVVSQATGPKPDKYIEEMLEQDTFYGLLERLQPCFPRLTYALKKFRKRKLLNVNPPPSRLGYPYEIWELKILEEPNFSKYRKTIRELADNINHSGIPHFFVTLGGGFNYMKWWMRYKPVEKLFKAFGIPFYNNLDLTINHFSDEAYSPLQLAINPANGHPGFILTNFYAKYVADILERDFPEVLPDKQHEEAVFDINDWVPYNLRIAQEENIVRFVYPKKEELMRRMPYGYKYVQLNLARPVNISRIKLKGEFLDQARLDLTFHDIDDIEVHQMEQKKGKSLVWRIDEKEFPNPVKTIRISASFDKDKNKDGGLSALGLQRLLQLECEISEN